MDSLTVNVQAKRQDLVGENNALLPVVSNLDMSAADVGLVDKNAAASALCNIEENPEVVEDEVSVVMEALEKKLWLPSSREEEEGEEMAVTDGKSAIFSRVKDAIFIKNGLLSANILLSLRWPDTLGGRVCRAEATQNVRGGGPMIRGKSECTRRS